VGSAASVRNPALPGEVSSDVLMAPEFMIGCRRRRRHPRQPGAVPLARGVQWVRPVAWNILGTHVTAALSYELSLRISRCPWEPSPS
jgi:hypothetical protein